MEHVKSQLAQIIELLGDMRGDFSQAHRELRDGLDNLAGVPNALQTIKIETAAIMADLAQSRKDYKEAMGELTKAIISLLRLGGVGLFFVVILCLAGFFGRNFVVGSGSHNASFTAEK